MKIQYEKISNENPYVTSKCVFKFKIVDSILKSHYKALARMSMLFNSSERNAGFIRINDEKAFLDLVAKIENSNDKRCATSHKKAVEKYKSRKSVCDHADLGSLGYRHGDRVRCPMCGEMCEVW